MKNLDSTPAVPYLISIIFTVLYIIVHEMNPESQFIVKVTFLLKHDNYNAV